MTPLGLPHCALEDCRPRRGDATLLTPAGLPRVALRSARATARRRASSSSCSPASRSRVSRSRCVLREPMAPTRWRGKHRDEDPQALPTALTHGMPHAREFTGAELSAERSHYPMRAQAPWQAGRRRAMPCVNSEACLSSGLGDPTELGRCSTDGPRGQVADAATDPGHYLDQHELDCVAHCWARAGADR